MFNAYTYTEDSTCIINISPYGRVRIYNSETKEEVIFLLTDVALYKITYKDHSNCEINEFDVRLLNGMTVNFVIRNRYVMNVIDGYLADALVMRSKIIDNAAENTEAYKELLDWLESRIKILPRKWRDPILNNLYTNKQLYNIKE